MGSLARQGPLRYKKAQSRKVSLEALRVAPKQVLSKQFVFEDKELANRFAAIAPPELKRTVSNLASVNVQSRVRALNKIYFEWVSNERNIPFLRSLSPLLALNLSHHSSAVRDMAVRTLAFTAVGKPAIPYLKTTLFDLSVGVRNASSSGLIRLMGYRAATNFVMAVCNSKKHLGGKIHEVPSEFFLSPPRFGGPDYTKLTLALRNSRNRSISEEAVRLVRRNNPIFFHRGFPVYLSDKLGRKTLGRYINGCLFVSTKIPEEFRPIIAEHEFGEIFSHEIGIALEFLYAKRKGLLQDYLNYGRMTEGLEELLYEDPKGFAEFKAELKKHYNQFR